MRGLAALLFLFLLLATAALALESGIAPDPLAQFRTADGRLTIPGSSLTPEVQHLLFGGNDLQTSFTITFVLPKRSAYPTVEPIFSSFDVPNLNVFVHPRQTPETWGGAIDHLIQTWFRPIDWHRVATESLASVRGGIAWFFDLFTANARADTVSVDSTTVVVVDPAAVDFSATGLVSAFLRHRLGEPPLAGASPRNVVQVADPALPRKSRPSDRRQIRRNRERGYALELVPGAETSIEQRAGFVVLYEQTMRRTDAGRRYFFDPSYFDRVLSAERTWLALATDPKGELAAASIATVSDGYLHYYLSGSADARLSDSPMKNVVAFLIDHAEQLGLPLNLGGGIDRADALEEFKRGFANREEQWLTSEVVCDPAAYERLSRGREAGGFFPAYRAP